ncbi:MAG: NusG domain II-containing protein [Mogibacterium sp.]|nr:NusG domain II-containing protein [Mogibacterium sp.]
MREFFRKADLILMAVLVVTGIAASVCLSFQDSVGDRVVITVAGELYGTYPLAEDRIVTVTSGDHANTVEIRDGTVRVTEASCKNQICVKHASITRAGESIICLPNRVVVRIDGKGEGYDAISS